MGCIKVAQRCIQNLLLGVDNVRLDWVHLNVPYKKSESQAVANWEI